MKRTPALADRSRADESEGKSIMLRCVHAMQHRGRDAGRVLERALLAVETETLLALGATRKYRAESTSSALVRAPLTTAVRRDQTPHPSTARAMGGGGGNGPQAAKRPQG